MRRLFVGILSLSFAAPIAAYEVNTHGAMTYNAIVRSILYTPGGSELSRLGLHYANNVRYANAFGSRYFDLQQATQEVTARFANSPGYWPANFEAAAFASAQLTGQALSIPGWAARGGIREDDYVSLFEIPQDDLCNETHSAPCFRVFHHFFDPYNDRALQTTGSIIEQPIKSPIWALGSTNPFSPLALPNAARRNHFSIVDAREYMYRALTLTTANGAGGYVDIFPGATASDRARAQAAYWASAFRALGSVLHHVQDVAQPQHTRLDSHGSGSFYEKFVDARTSGASLLIPNSGAEVPLEPLDYWAYPTIPTFRRYSDFWSTSVGANSLTGKGMADYSSRGFYSAGTNIGSTQGAQFPQPQNSPALVSLQPLADPRDILGQPFSGQVQVARADVVDSLDAAQTATSVNLSSHSAFDEFLLERIGRRKFTLNHYNYNEQANLLIPRAVAYSTGLVNYFFRGRLKIQAPPERVYGIQDFSSNTGFTRFKILLQNETAPITPPGGSSQAETMGGGTVVAVLRYRLNTCLQWPSLQGSPIFNSQSSWEEACRSPSLRDANGEVFPLFTVSEPRSVPSGTLDQATPLALIFNFANPLPFNATDVELHVVYRGVLGEERDAIAVGFKQVSEPTFFNFDNFRDCQQGTTCTVGGCNDTQTASLPFEGGIDVVSAVNLPAGRYGRVVFISDGWRKERETTGVYDYVAVNQDFPYATSTIIDGVNYGNYPAGVVQFGGLHQSRGMMAWRSARRFNPDSCKDPECYYAWANACPAISPEPWPVTVRSTFWEE